MPHRLALLVALVAAAVQAAAPPPRDNGLGGASARFGSPRFRHAAIVPVVAWSPDGSFLASGSHMGTIRLWNPVTGDLRREIKTPGGVTALAISPDSKTVATGSWDRVLRFWDANSGAPTRMMSGHQGEICSLRFAPDGKSIASGGKDGSVRLWDAATGKLLRQIDAHPGTDVRCVAFSRDGKRLASCATDNLAKVWDANTGKPLLTLKGHTKQVMGVAFSPDGNTLATTAHDATARLWNAADGKEKRLIKQTGFGEGVEFAPDGKSFAISWGWSHKVMLFDLDSKGNAPRWSGKSMHSLAVAFSPDGTKLAGSAWEATVRVWDTASGREEGSIREQGHSSWVFAVAPLPGGRVVTAGSDNQVIVWGPDGKELRRLPGHPDRVNCLAVSPDGKTVAGGGRDNNVRVWDWSTGKVLKLFVAGGMVRSVAFSPDGKQLASSSGNDVHDPWVPVLPAHNASVWDLATGQRIKLEGHEGGVGAIAWSPDGKTLATAGNDGTVRLWDASSGRELRRLPTQPGPVECVAFSPDGETLAAGGKDGLNLYEAATGKLLHALPMGQAWVVRLTFSPDGRSLLAAGKMDREEVAPLRLFDVATGGERGRFGGHQATAFGVAFTKDGRTMITGGGDGTVLLWDVTMSNRPGVGDVKVAWEDIAGDDAAKAHRAVWELAAAPKRVLPLLREALKAVPDADPKLIARLVGDLDDEDFTKRQKATDELERVGDAAAPALRKVFEEGSAESSNRARRLLDLLEAKHGSERRLRELRGVEVLEHVGNAEARALLQELAKGAAEASLTREAKAALGRLARRER